MLVEEAQYVKQFLITDQPEYTGFILAIANPMEYINQFLKKAESEKSKQLNHLPIDPTIAFGSNVAQAQLMVNINGFSFLHM